MKRSVQILPRLISLRLTALTLAAAASLAPISTARAQDTNKAGGGLQIAQVSGTMQAMVQNQVKIAAEDKKEYFIILTDQTSLQYRGTAEPDFLMQEGEEICCGEVCWQLISAPGHSPASICMYDPGQKILIAGDVIFFESIGRTDLPGGNHQQLLQHIHGKILKLPDDVKVYPGHGPTTTIGHERIYNPFRN